MLSHLSTLIAVPAATQTGAGATADITSLTISTDMAFVLNQAEANTIANFSSVAPQPFTIANGTVTYDGELNPLGSSSPISFGVQGDAIGTGISVSMQLTAGATVNNHAYAGPISFVAIPYAFQLQEQSLALSTAAQNQLTYLSKAYGNNFQSTYWGLDLGKLTIPTQPAPAGWAAADWTALCTALQDQLNASPLPNCQLTLLQGITPNGNQTGWNYGPTSWCCFNVPPLDSTCQPAIVFAFMVDNTSMAPSPTSGFQQVQLFNAASGGANALLVVAGHIVLSNLVPALMPAAALQAAAEIGVTVSTTGNGLEQYNISNGTVSAAGSGLAYAGSTTQKNQYSSFRYFTTASATTTTSASVGFGAPENGLNQQLIASGSYTISGSTGGNQDGWQFSVPQAIFTWSICGVMQVTGTGVVSFATKSQFPPSFPNTPANISGSDYGWWTSPPGLAPTLVPSSALAWGTAASNQISGRFCQGSTNGQVNLFAFPGGALYQDAVGGINQANNLILNLTYVIG